MERTDRLGWRDALLPAALLALGAAELALVQPPSWGYAVAVEALAAVLLVPRRRWPLVLAPLASGLVLLLPFIGPQLDDVAAPILFSGVALYSLGRWLAGLIGVLGVVLVILVIGVDYGTVDQRVHDWTDVVFVGVLTIPPYVAGRLVRRLAEQGELLRRNQELVRREAVRAERDRIARELHDVVAHSVSAMVVQTAAAQDLVRSDPDRAASVLEEVAATGRRALTETGRLLHVIRDEGDELGLDPAPGVAQLPELVEAFRASGLDVDYAAERLPQLPPVLDVSVYRIVQEALTNALKHGADRSAAVRVSATRSALSILASNSCDGRTGGGSGLGLVGIAERVQLLGGRLTHQQAPSGRFELAVTLPLATGERQ